MTKYKTVDVLQVLEAEDLNAYSGEGWKLCQVITRPFVANRAGATRVYFHYIFEKEGE